MEALVIRVRDNSVELQGANSEMQRDSSSKQIQFGSIGSKVQDDKLKGVAPDQKEREQVMQEPQGEGEVQSNSVQKWKLRKIWINIQLNFVVQQLQGKAFIILKTHHVRRM